MKLYQVDSFTDTVFKGNPAGVCISDERLSDELMQQIACEMNLSETAFAVKNDDCWDIRFFTPRAEIALCGHATLATAHCLYDDGVVLRNESIHFASKAGVLHVECDAGWLRMSFPEYEIEPSNKLDAFCAETGIKAIDVYSSKDGWIIGIMASEDAVAEAQPQFEAMRNSEFNHVIITAASNNKSFDYVLRVFAPIYGVNEDPVTGVAECMLAPYWHQQTGKTRFMVQQLSQRRGIKKVSYQKPRVVIEGQAVKVFSFSFCNTLT